MEIYTNRTLQGFSKQNSLLYTSLPFLLPFFLFVSEIRLSIHSAR
jgi:hypothetical protein